VDPRAAKEKGNKQGVEEGLHRNHYYEIHISNKNQSEFVRTCLVKQDINS